MMTTTVQVRVAAGFADEAAEIEWGWRRTGTDSRPKLEDLLYVAGYL